MGKLVIKHHLITKENAEALVSLCPFGAITYENGRADISAACKLCKVCVRKSDGLVEFKEDRQEIDRLGAEAVALTHGSPTAFLSAAVLTHIISLLLQYPKGNLKKIILASAAAVREQFGHQYSQAYDLATMLRHAVTFAESPGLRSVDVMERLQCENAAQVLAGAIYACLVSHEDFDRAMVVAVNHSGRSAAVGAIVGAILGIRLGEEALPEFYIECLEPAEVLRELADDLHSGCPMEVGNKLFDLDWDYKYLHGGM